MPDILIATDAAHVLDELVAAIGGGGTTIRHVASGHHVRAVVGGDPPDLLVVDLQIGSMGGMAVTTDLRLEAGIGRLPTVRILMLLDRHADVFLARRSGADGWLVKPLDALRIERAVAATLDGGGWFEGVDEAEWPALSAAARGEAPPEPDPAPIDETVASSEAG